MTLLMEHHAWYHLYPRAHGTAASIFGVSIQLPATLPFSHSLPCPLPTSPLPCPSHSLLCFLSLSLPCGWTRSSLSSAWRMKSASRPSTTTTAGWPISGAPVTSHWSWWAPRVSQVLQTPGSSVLMGLGNTILL